tara:strand:- start:2404 stop:3300 length:897 start_codon:yes stop_codon:yes gene_type:complete
MEVKGEKERVCFLLYKDFFNSVEHFSDQDLGKLFRVIHEYQRSDNWTLEQEQKVDPIIRVAFAFYKNQFILDDAKWQKKVNSSRNNGAKGGRPVNPNKPTGLTGLSDKPKKGVTVTDTVTETGTETAIVKVNDQINIKNLKQKELVESVISDLNDKLNLSRGFSCKSKNNVSRIVARLKEGFTLDDFLVVHKNKIAQWQNDPEMARFLRPETLHGNKFESYLNEKEVKDITPTKPKYQTADERRNENNKQVFENTIKEIDNVHRTGTGTGNDETENIGAGFSSKETEGNSSFFKQLRS